MTVTTDQVGIALGRSSNSDAESNQWQMWIDDAYRLIDNGARRRGVTVTSLDSGDIDYVVRESVVAHAKRPDAATQVDVQVEDGRVSRRYETSTGRVVLNDDWWDYLLPAGSTSSAFSFGPDGSTRAPGSEWAW